MNSKYILGIGFVIATLYIWAVVALQGSIDTKNDFKYLFIKDNNSVVVVAKLPDNSVSKELIRSLKVKCKKLKCSIDSSFSKTLSQSINIEFFKKLQEFSLAKKLSHASLIAMDKEIEINFLLENQKDFEALKKIYKPFEDNFFIKDKSSVIKFFDVSSIESDINQKLKQNILTLKVLNLDLKTIKLLNQIFRKMKALGVVKVDFMINTDKSTEKLKKYILENYDWLKDINITKSKKNSIKIKEVQ